MRKKQTCRPRGGSIAFAIGLLGCVLAFGLFLDAPPALAYSAEDTDIVVDGSVAILGDTVVAGAPSDDDNGSSSGSAYVFEIPDFCPGDDNRYEDQGDGTVLDCNTGLLWLRNASCAELADTDADGRADWNTAQAAADGLNDGEGGFFPCPEPEITIGNFVWLDDGNGLQEEAEIGISGVLLNLFDCSGPEPIHIVSTVTGGGGEYSFTVTAVDEDCSAVGRDLVVEVDPANFDPDGPLHGLSGSWQDSSPDDVDSDCGPGARIPCTTYFEDALTRDCGFFPCPEPEITIGNFVWLDDGNGLQEEAEIGISGVLLNLFDCSGPEPIHIVSTVTGGGGEYSFTVTAVDEDCSAVGRDLVVEVDPANFDPDGPLHGLSGSWQDSSPDDVDSDCGPGARIPCTTYFEDALTRDCGFFPCPEPEITIGNFVWLDDGNGLQEEAEIGISGVLLNLFDCSGPEPIHIVSTVTGGGGEYSFTVTAVDEDCSAVGRDLVVEVDPANFDPDGPLHGLSGSWQDSSPDDVDSDCGPGARIPCTTYFEDALTRDCGFFPCPEPEITIGNFVWLDDGNGLQEEAEIGISGVLLNLFDCSGPEPIHIVSTVTGGGGEYSFTVTAVDEDCSAVGRDLVVEVDPANFDPDGPLHGLSGSWQDSSPDDVDSDCGPGARIPCTTYFEDALTRDCGFFPCPEPEITIGNFVWLDDGNGLQEEAEIGISGVLLNLFDCSGPEPIHIVSTVTGGGGEYSFTVTAVDEDCSAVGRDLVVEVDPANFDPDGPLHGLSGSWQDSSPDDVDSDCGPGARIPCTTYFEDALTRDCGFFPCPEPEITIGNFVWLDDGNGLQEEAEIGISGVLLNLFDCSGPEPIHIVSTVTGGGGEYSFTVTAVDEDCSAVGRDLVVEVDPANFDPDGPLHGLSGSWQDSSPDDVDSDCGPGARIPCTTYFEDALTRDCGFFPCPEPEITIGNFVWLDDGNGLQEEAEIGISGVLLNLFDCSGPEPIHIDTTFSNEGEYSFTVPAADEDCLPVSRDLIVEVDPSNFDFGGPLHGLNGSPADSADDAIDSDCPPDARTACTTYFEDDLTRDCGFFDPCLAPDAPDCSHLNDACNVGVCVNNGGEAECEPEPANESLPCAASRCVDAGAQAGGGTCTQTDFACDSGSCVPRVTTVYTDTCGGDVDNPSVTWYGCSPEQTTCVSHLDSESDSCTDSGSQMGGGSCSAVNWACDGDGVLSATLTVGDDHCEALPDNPSVTYYSCSASDGTGVDTCESGETQRFDSCTDTVDSELGGGTCSAEDWVCQNGELVQTTSSGSDTCGGNDDTPDVTYFSCVTDDGNVFDKCQSGETHRSDRCEDDGDELGGGTCNATDWVCENGLLSATTSAGDDFCKGTDDNPSVEYFTCSAGDGSAIDSCVSDTTERSDSCADEGDEFGGGSCAATDWDCASGRLQRTDTAAIDVCSDGTTTFSSCEASDGTQSDRCVTDETLCAVLDETCADGLCDVSGGSCETVNRELGDPCRDGNTFDTSCTDPDICDGEGVCLPNNQPCAVVTSSSLCTFDVQPDKGMCSESASACLFDSACEAAGGTSCGDGLCLDEEGYALQPPVQCADGCEGADDYCEQSGQFRLLFTPDVKNFPAYKLPASNPGQTFYNFIVKGEADSAVPVAVEIRIPYPYVTQGAQPVHVYDGANVVGACLASDGSSTGQPCSIDTDCGEGEICDSSCFAPGEAEQQFDVRWTIEDYFDVDGAGDPRVSCDYACGPNGTGSCVLDVDIVIPDSGVAYVNLHLDYGLKGLSVDANPCDDETVDRYDQGDSSGDLFAEVGFDAWVNSNTEDGLLGIADCTNYRFSHDDGTEAHGDSVQNFNAFKRIAGSFGRCTHENNGNPCNESTAVELIKNKTGNVVQVGVTDEDGFWATPYRHRGKPALYTVVIYEPGCPFLSQEIELQGNGWANVDFDASTCTSTVEYGKGRNRRR